MVRGFLTLRLQLKKLAQWEERKIGPQRTTGFNQGGLNPVVFLGNLSPVRLDADGRLGYEGRLHNKKPATIYAGFLVGMKKMLSK